MQEWGGTSSYSTDPWTCLARASLPEGVDMTMAVVSHCIMRTFPQEVERSSRSLEAATIMKMATPTPPRLHRSSKLPDLSLQLLQDIQELSTSVRASLMVASCPGRGRWEKSTQEPWCSRPEVLHFKETKQTLPRWKCHWQQHTD